MRNTVLQCLPALLVVLNSCSSVRTEQASSPQQERWIDKSIPTARTSHQLVPMQGDRAQESPRGSRPSPRRISREARDLMRVRAEANFKRGLKPNETELTPLFEGYGSHFAYVYVGTPPQRQSVIVDTGSHYTAFPCAGCKDCGEHTDSYWDQKKSSTASVPKCDSDGKPASNGKGSQCMISQKYQEGSSWDAYLVKDQLWVGAFASELGSDEASYSIPFRFGCQTTESGLFRSQLADGIMGMAASPDTLPSQLFQNGVTDSKVFALCYRMGGGIMTLGGADQSIHRFRGPIDYARLVPKQGLYTVEVTEIVIGSAATATVKSVNATSLNSGKGAVVDSGTTDTFLPKAVAGMFKNAFKEASGGIEYTSEEFSLTEEELQTLPVITFRLTAHAAWDPESKSMITGKPVEVQMPYHDYIDDVGDGKYSFRITLNEPNGATLGANFMNDYNFIFDPDAYRLGVAASDCSFDDFAPIETMEPTRVPTEHCIPEMIPYTECSARCEQGETAAYISTGTQDWVDRCKMEGNFDVRPCSENCTMTKIVRGDPECPDKAWSECDHSCVTSRMSVPITEPVKIHGKCNYRQQNSACYTGMCPIQDGDFIVYVDLRARIEPWKWDYVYTEAFYDAINSMFKLKPHAIELLNNANSEYTSGTQLHFQIRLKKKDYKSVAQLSDAAEHIALRVHSQEFPGELVQMLDKVSRPQDKDQLRRFGWMFADDITVLNAVATPIGDVRDPYGLDTVGGANGDDEGGLTMQTEFDLILLGIALTAVLMFVCLSCAYCRLSRERFELEKEKISLAGGGGSMHKLMRNIAEFAKVPTEDIDDPPVKGAGAGSSGASRGRGGDVEMSSLSLMQEEDE